MKMEVHVLGIRHHGCGSARSVKNALAELNPDIVLIEGAPEANGILPLAIQQEMRPPVAILIYSPENPDQAVFYPFADFSPEWQAIQFALNRKIVVRFIDLPQSARLSDVADRFSTDTQLEKEVSKNRAPKSEIKADPLQFAAEAAGFSDGEIWWENLIENRQNAVEIFDVIIDLMTVLRNESEKNGETEDLQTLRREAFMRQEIRRAAQEGFAKAAVVCGAWHAPKLTNLDDEKTDNEILIELPKAKLEATWIPYTFSRLTFGSGYGAGIRSPEFYRQMWESPHNITAYWLARVARLLREQDLDASSASVIEAVRLAEGLAAMRGLSAAGLNELLDSAKAVFCNGDDVQLRLIEEKLIVGEVIGEVPPETPHVPLQRDLKAMQKRLRFKPESAQKLIELDLRKANDLEKSQLLHRLNLLEIEWGIAERTYGKGTFKEKWRIQWHPEFEIKIIEASLYGNSVVEAAVNFIREKIEKQVNLSTLTLRVQEVLLADLPAAIEILMNRLQEVAAVTSDVPQMMDAFVPLADIFRYGNVRKTETSAVGKITDGLLTRICIGLPNACSALNDESAERMLDRILALDNAVSILQNNEYSSQWQSVLVKLALQKELHGLVAGRSVRILFEWNKFAAEEVEKRMNLAVSTAVSPEKAVSWIAGFLRGSGMILLYNESLLKILNDWVLSLNEQVFIQLLPLLRRTFSSFESPERRKIGDKLNSADSVSKFEASETEIETPRADRVLPLLEQILGI